MVESVTDLINKLSPGSPVEDLLRLCNHAESDWIEFKASHCTREDDRQQNENDDDALWNVVKSVIALRNSLGGIVLLGIKDKPVEVIGVDGTEEYRRLFQEQLNRKSFSLGLSNYNIKLRYSLHNMFRLHDWKLEDNSILGIEVFQCEGINPFIVSQIDHNGNHRKDIVYYRNFGDIGSTKQYCTNDKFEAQTRLHVLSQYTHRWNQLARKLERLGKAHKAGTQQNTEDQIAFDEDGIFQDLRRSCNHLISLHHDLPENQLSFTKQSKDGDYLGHPLLLRGTAGSGKTVCMLAHLDRVLMDRVDKEPLTIACLCYNRTLMNDLKKMVKHICKIRNVGENSITVNTVDSFLEKHLKNYLNGANGLRFDNVNSKITNTLKKIENDRGQNAPLYDAYAALLKNDRQFFYKQLENNSPFYEIVKNVITNSKDEHVFHRLYMKNILKVFDPARQVLLLLKRSRVDKFATQDAIYVDEVQDLSEEQIRAVHLCCKPDGENYERNLILFYDDAQNLYAQNRPKWSDLGIVLDRGARSKILNLCYRTPRYIVEFALNVLLGSCAELQSGMREYVDINHLIKGGFASKREGNGQDWYSVQFCVGECSMDSVPVVNVEFNNRDQELTELLNNITKVRQNGAKGKDILVISDDKNRKLVKNFLEENGCNIYVARENTLAAGDDYSIVLASVRLCKGFGFRHVFIMGADSFLRVSPTNPSEDTKKKRAEFYVACTRAKKTLYISGISGENTPTLLNEVKQCWKQLEKEIIR